MLFLSSLLIAVAFSVLCGKAIRKHPALFYLGAAVCSIGTAILANQRLSVPVFVQQNILALFTKGILAAAFWAVIMWTGALPNTSELRKKLLPQRGQLSIFAAILTLGHAVGLGITMLPRWLQKADALNLTICIVLMLIMLPLTVISVQKIRRKMNAKTWKTVQRSAYVFYALIPVHVIALNIVKARSGRQDVLLNLMLYLVVFLGYAVCRVYKWYQIKRKPERVLWLKLASWGAFLVGMTVFAAAAFPQKQAETVQTKSAEIHEELTQTETTTAETTTETQKTSTEKTTSESSTEKTEETETTAETTVEPEETTGSSETTVTALTADPAMQTETVPVTTTETLPPAPVRIFQDGIFTAQAYGYDGMITVHVTIQNDVITAITAETDESDLTYFFDAKNFVVPLIVARQIPEVDACSGATYSSVGIMTAVRAAMEQARL